MKLIKIATKSEKGMTLVEILASLVILSIIIISFLTLFNLSARNNKSSENITNATYLAQDYMEKIYAETKNGSFDIFLQKIENKIHPWIGWKKGVSPDSWKIEKPAYQFLREEGNYLLVIGLWKPQNEKRDSRVIVKVYNSSLQNKLEAQMETILFWEGN